MDIPPPTGMPAPRVSDIREALLTADNREPALTGK